MKTSCKWENPPYPFVLKGLKPIELNLEYPNIVEKAFQKFQQVEDYASKNTLPRRLTEKKEKREKLKENIKSILKDKGIRG